MTNNPSANAQASGSACVTRTALDEFRRALEDLTFNSKPIINGLTMMAHENSALYSVAIVPIVEDFFLQTPHKLPALYLIDSICKNLAPPLTDYVQLFSKNIARLFSAVFLTLPEDTGGRKTKTDFLRVLQTWHNVFDPSVIISIEERILPRHPAQQPQHSLVSPNALSFQTPATLPPFQPPQIPPQFQPQGIAPYLNSSTSNITTFPPFLQSYPQPFFQQPAQPFQQESEALSLLQELESFLNTNTKQIASSRRQFPNVPFSYVEINKSSNNHKFLYESLSLQCHICGIRFHETERKEFDDHLDIHFRKARRMQENVRVYSSRGWFVSPSEWTSPLQGMLKTNSLPQKRMTEDRHSPVHSGDENGNKSKKKKGDSRSGLSLLPSGGEEEGIGALERKNLPLSVTGKACSLCNENFDTEWDPDSGQWLALNTAQIENKFAHLDCLSGDNN